LIFFLKKQKEEVHFSSLCSGSMEVGDSRGDEGEAEAEIEPGEEVEETGEGEGRKKGQELVALGVCTST
jgi:hypothetical protein